MGKGFDLSRAVSVGQAEDDGQVVHLRDAGGELEFGDNGQPVTVTIAGSYSARYRKVQDSITQRMLKRKQLTLTPEQLMENRIELIASCVLGWTEIEDDGKPLPCTKDNAARLVRVAPWVRDQLEEAQHDHAGFTKGSSAT